MAETEASLSRWTERQRRMLAAMGLRVWAPAEPADVAVVAAAVAAAVAAPAAAGAAVVDPAAPAEACKAASVAAAQPRRPSAPAMSDPLPGNQAVVAKGTAADSTAVDTGWLALRAAVAACTRCRLHEGRTHAVFGSGAEDAAWLVVGDPPAADEDAAGEPFVGDAGVLLDRMLAALGLSRENEAGANAIDHQPRTRRVYTTLALRCRPAAGGPAGANEWAACQGHLQQQIALLQPRVLLVLGRIAAQSLLRSDAPIGQLRGQVHHDLGLPLVVSYHPAYLLRHPDLKAAAWEDLCRAAALVDGV
ncbi:MAG: uracil-DNA glycosylase [Rubrivivax sp.]